MYFLLPETSGYTLEVCQVFGDNQEMAAISKTPPPKVTIEHIDVA